MKPSMRPTARGDLLVKKKSLIGLGGLAALLVVAILTLVITGGPLADLRPSVLTTAPQPDREAKGRALLESAWKAAGGAESLAHPAARFQFRDHWRGFGTLFNPWPDNDQRVDFVLHTHTFDSRATFLNGAEAGVTWGIDELKGWRRTGDGKKVPTDDSKLRFMLPTVHYFMEMPQRLTEATVVRWIETKSIAERTYDVVFATWNTVEAHDAADQYLVFIDQETGRIGKVKYTVQEMARFAAGTCHLDDRRPIDGVYIPHVMSVTAEPEDDVEGYMHRMTVSDFTWLEARTRADVP